MYNKFIIIDTKFSLLLITNLGRVDLTVFIEDKIYIIEFKVIDNEQLTMNSEQLTINNEQLEVKNEKLKVKNESSNSALNQIKAKKYYQKYQKPTNTPIHQ